MKRGLPKSMSESVVKVKSLKFMDFFLNLSYMFHINHIDMTLSKYLVLSKK